MTTALLAMPDVGAAPEVLPFPRRILKHPRLMHYNRLVALVMTINLGWAVYGATNWWTLDGADLGALALVAQTNLAAAVLFRQQYVLNALGWLVTRPPTSWPLRVRWALGKYYHFGGLHVGAAVAGTLWYLILMVSIIRDAVAGDLLTAPAFWLVLLSVLMAVWPWLLLRRVPISYERPSSHAVILRLDHGTSPAVGTTRPISRRPFAGWHHFANVPASPGTTGYRMLVSRAGDWTSALVDEPPTHVWVRGIPTVGVANVRKLFTKVVIVATGSGIGPVLGHLLDTSVPSRLVWVTKNPRLTYGDAFVDEIEAPQPDALIWDTGLLGKPDVLQLAYDAYVESGAEAVICVSNRTVTWEVVHALERCGIPAFGPIWDS